MTAIKKNTLLGDLAEASEKLAGTRSRRQKTALLVELLAKVPEDELAAAVGWLIEEPLCGPLGIGFAQLSELAQRPLGHGGIDAPVSLREVEVVLGQARGRHRAEAHAL